MRPSIFALLLVIAIVGAAEAGAARYYVKGFVESGGSGLSWAEAKKTIAEAVDAATSGSEVWVAAGTYTATTTGSLVTMKSYVAVHGGFAGTESSLSQRNIAANPTVLDGACLSNHVVTADGLSSGALSGFVIQRGNNPNGRGAGLYINSVYPMTVSYCTIRANSSQNGGLNITNSSDVYLDHCLIVNNRSWSNGGGIYATNASLFPTNCTVVGNTGYLGGGFYLAYGSVCQARQCTFSGNVATQGAGIYAAGIIELDNCLLTGNKALQKAGGIYSSSGADLYYCTFDCNTAQMGGGGASYIAIGDLGQSVQRMRNCIISNNGAQAIHMDYYYDPMTSAGIWFIPGYDLFYNNVGGDITFDAPGGGPATTLTGAAAINDHYGSQSFRDGNPAFDTSACPSGTWTDMPVFDRVTSTTLLTCSGANLQPGALVGKLINPNVTHQPIQCYIIANTQTTITIDADATSFASVGNSWQVMNYSLSSGSPAIDAGSAENDVTQDFIGTPRPTGSAFDMGAYEYIAGPTGPMDIVWLDFPWGGAKMGTEPQPFSTLDDALTWVTDGGTIKIKPGSAAISKRITKQVRIEAPSGGARIGEN